MKTWLPKEKQKEIVSAALGIMNDLQNRDRFFSQDPAVTNPWMLPDGLTMRRYTLKEFLALPPDAPLTDIFGVSFLRSDIPEDVVSNPMFVVGEMTAFGKVTGH